MNTKSIAQMLKEIRKQRTQFEIAQLLQIHPSQVWRLEQGENCRYDTGKKVEQLHQEICGQQ